MNSTEAERLASDFIEMLVNINHKFYRRLTMPLPVNQFVTLMVVCSERELSIKEISDLVRISKQQLTSIIEKLASAGFVTKKPDPSDHRRILVTVSKAGLAFVQKQSDVVRGRFLKNVQKLPEEQKRDLADAIEKVNRYIEPMQVIEEK